MDIKIIDFHSRIDKLYRLDVFKYINEILENEKTEFEKIHGKLCAWYRMEFNNKTLVRFSIVKNKTCYTIYCSQSKI